MGSITKAIVHDDEHVTELRLVPCRESTLDTEAKCATDGVIQIVYRELKNGSPQC